MPALDQCHHQIVNALKKAGWNVSRTPYILYIASQRRVYIDIFAQRENGNGSQSLIIAEAKCFVDDRSELNDLYVAVGQYIVYRNWLKSVGADERLYLAVPTRAYTKTIQTLGAGVVSENRIKMIVVDLETEVIQQWLD